LVGADICGFEGNTNEELCCRWTGLGAFYPFARNHNAKGQTDQEPYNWASVTRVAIKTLNARQSLTPYYYSLFYQAYKNGGAIARGLFYEFPQDSKTYAIDTQYMMGPAVLITPVLTQGATTVTGYFPPSANWYNFWDGTPLSSTGSVTLNSPMEDLQVHIRGGNILPMSTPASTTTQSKKLPYSLLVALDTSGQANGFVFIDDGDTLNIEQEATIVQYMASAGTLKSTITQATQTAAPPNLGKITVLGTKSVSSVTVNGASTAFSYNATAMTLSFNTNLPMAQPFTAMWV